MADAIRSIRDRIRRFAADDPTESVHFHQGPQGRPAPCFDARHEPPPGRLTQERGRTPFLHCLNARPAARPAAQWTRQPRPGGKPTCTSPPSRTIVGTTPPPFV
jgi:hypothetical protein